MVNYINVTDCAPMTLEIGFLQGQSSLNYTTLHISSSSARSFPITSTIFTLLWTLSSAHFYCNMNLFFCLLRLASSIRLHFASTSTSCFWHHLRVRTFVNSERIHTYQEYTHTSQPLRCTIFSPSFPVLCFSCVCACPRMIRTFRHFRNFRLLVQELLNPEILLNLRRDNKATITQLANEVYLHKWRDHQERNAAKVVDSYICGNRCSTRRPTD